MVHSVLRWLSAALVVSLGGLDAQCEPRWLQGDWAATAFLGAAPELCAAQVWDPDGPGPEGPRLAIAGRFGHADPACNHIAIWDPALADWSAGAALGGGLDGAVSALANLPNGELIVGGAFLAAGAVGAARIASWDGSTWSPLGSGLDGDVLALTTTVGGEVVAAGEFTHAGGLPANRIARWDGVAWQPFGFGMDARVRALAAMPNGDLIAGGEFTSAGGVGVNGIARWNGSGWQPLGAGVNGAVHRLAVLASGELLVGGQFSFAGGVPIEALARWDGSGWHAVAPVHPGGTIRAIVELPNGDLVVGGSFQVAGVPGADDVARWDGVSWHAMGAGADDTVAALAILPDGALLAAGSFRVPGDLVAIWDGQRWNGTTGVLTPIAPTYAVHAAGDGAVYVGGAASFLDLGSGLRHPVARWDGRRWHALEANPVFAPSLITCITAAANGEVVVGGSFTLVATPQSDNVARWDGVGWRGLDSGTDGYVAALLSQTNGDLVIGGMFTSAGGVAARRIARWDGAHWHPVGAGIDGNGYVRALGRLPNGDLVVGGWFAAIGGVPMANVARWDGTAWHPLAAGVDAEVAALAVLDGGDVVAAGSFANAGGGPATRVARWDGTAWHAMGTGLPGSGVAALTKLPGDRILAVRRLAGAPDRLHLWDGTSWRLLGSCDDAVTGLATLPDGTLAAAGRFAVAGGLRSRSFARLVPSCPATEVDLPTACIGPAGALSLTSSGLPWAGTTWRSSCSGFAAGTLGAAFVGIGVPGQPLPLSALSPAALPGCDLQAASDAVLLTVPTGGVSGYALAIPSGPALAGLPLSHQFVQIEPGSGGTLASLSSSNTLVLGIGAL